MARPRTEITGELIPAPEIDVDLLDGQLVVAEAWVRATAILLRAQERRMVRQQGRPVNLPDSQAVDASRGHD